FSPMQKHYREKPANQFNYVNGLGHESAPISCSKLFDASLLPQGQRDALESALGPQPDLHRSKFQLRVSTRKTMQHDGMGPSAVWDRP
ncbi:hypothetical protein, partial [Bradyrhizobium sp. 176]|uniref:hypothetical protein n=1 Tax=Bradyrhizobium sp. 176 TaxID=2782646 RepID=UPI001FF882D0